MAEDKTNNAETPQAAVATSTDSGSKSKILMILVIINMSVVLGVGYMLWKSRQKPPTEIQQVIEGEKKTQEQEKTAVQEEIGKVIPLETFVVNLAGSKGRKVLKVNMELEVKGQEVIQEIDNRKAQIRDFIIIILSSKTFEEISTKEGKDNLRNEIKDNINTSLSKGKVSNVYFTELIYN